MKRLKWLWPALEGVGGPAATALEWRALAGNEAPILQKLLRPRQELASSYPCPIRGRFGVRHDVIEDAPGRYAGVCPDGCKEEALSKADIVVHELNVGALIKAIRSAFQLQGTTAPVDGTATGHRVGTHIRPTEHHVGVYLALASSSPELHGVVDRIAAFDDGAFILLAPTANQLNRQSEAVLEKRRSWFVALCDAIGLDGRGRLASLRDIEQMIQHPRKVKKGRSGRRKLPDKEVARRRRLWEGWEQVRGKGGKTKAEYCKDKGITPTLLDNCRRLIQQRQARETK